MKAIVNSWNKKKFNTVNPFSGLAVFHRYAGETNLVSYTAHFAGGIVGFLLGVVLLRNLSYKTWERATWWCSLLIFFGLFLGAIVWNAIEIFGIPLDFSSNNIIDCHQDFLLQSYDYIC